MSWLRDGLESREPFDELEDLRERGLVSVQSRELLMCGTPDRLAYGHDCDGWAEAGDPDGQVADCEMCGRPLDDGELDMVHTLTVNREAIVAELDRMFDARRLRDGVAWSVEGEHDDVLVVVADWSDGTRWMSNRVLSGRPFVLVQVDKSVTTSRLRAAEWLVTASLTEVLRDETILGSAIARAVELADVPRTGDVLTELHAVTSKVVFVTHGAHLVEFADAEVKVDGIVVKIPAGMRSVLAYLVDRHVEDTRDGKPADAYCTWSLEDMAEALALPRTTVRTQLCRFQDRLAAMYAEKVHRPLPEGSVLQVEGSAWRFSPDCLVRRVA